MLPQDYSSINVTQAVPCALILNELISNSYKHAFKHGDTGTIDITVTQKNDDVLFTIRDNGKGIPDNILNDTDQSSLGLTIVKTLIRQLEGTFNIKNDEGAFAEFQFKRKNNSKSSHDS